MNKNGLVLVLFIILIGLGKFVFKLVDLGF